MGSSSSKLTPFSKRAKSWGDISHSPFLSLQFPQGHPLPPQLFLSARHDCVYRCFTAHFWARATLKDSAN